MKKGGNVEKKSRSRNLKGLSIFDDEIAAPADYGDFMKIDAPVSLRTASTEAQIVQVVTPAPLWEKFIGNDGVPLVNEVKIETTSIEVNAPFVETVTEVKVESAIEFSNEIITSIIPEARVVEPPTVAMEFLPPEIELTERIQKIKSPVFEDTTRPKKETAHKLPTPPQRKADVESHKVVLPRTIQPRVELKSTGYQKITLSYGFGSLVGVQRRIVLFIFEDCVRSGKSETTPLTTEHLCQTLGLTYKTTRGSVWRLQQKSFLEVAASKEGRGGWVIYRLNRDIYSELLLLKSSNQLLERDIGIGAMTAETTVASVPRPEPIIAEEDKELASEWQAIDFSALESIHFTKYQVKQLEVQKKNKLSAKEVQDSINFFAFDLKYNREALEIKSDPLNFLMGILRNGSPYAPSPNYKSPEDLARSEYLSSLRAIEQARVEEEEEIKKLSMAEWFRSLTESDKAKIKEQAPSFAKEPGVAQKAFIECYFEEQIWPELRDLRVPRTNEQVCIAAEVRQSLTGNA